MLPAADRRGPERPPRPPPLPPPCDIPLGCCSFAGPWTVTRSSLRMLRRVAAFCRPLRPVLLRVSFPQNATRMLRCGSTLYQYMEMCTSNSNCHSNQKRPSTASSIDTLYCARINYHQLRAPPAFPSGGLFMQARTTTTDPAP